jgi:hypothetical protein
VLGGDFAVVVFDEAAVGEGVSGLGGVGISPPLFADQVP